MPPAPSPPRTRLALAALAALGLAGAALVVAAMRNEGEPLGLLAAPEAPFGAEILRVGKAGAEPTVGVTANGTLFVTGYSSDATAHVYRSTDRGATWHETARTLVPRVDVDPYLYVDPRTDRIWSVPLWKTCSHILWSDDDGETWQESLLAGRKAGCPHPVHDHQSLVAGVPPRGVQVTGAYPNVVYYAYNGDPGVGRGGTWLKRSLDGGESWDTGQVVFPSDCHGGLAGVPATGPRGEVYVVKPSCDGVAVAASLDGGATWSRVAIEEVGIMGGSDAPLETRRPIVPNPSVAVDAAGSAYVAWPGEDARVHVSASRDRGATWSAPLRASAPGVNATAFTALAAGDQGRLLLAYFGTDANTSAWPSNASHHAPPDTTWHLWLTLVTGAHTPTPTFQHARLTPDDDPVQRGCIWQGGGQEECRNLKDYIGIAERGGRAFVAYADGCRRCADAERSTLAEMHVAVLEDAPSLRGAGTLGSYR